MIENDWKVYENFYVNKWRIKIQKEGEGEEYSDKDRKLQEQRFKGEELDWEMRKKQ